MKALRKIANSFNQTIRFPADDRAIFYEILEIQIEAGMSLDESFGLLYKEKVAPAITEICVAGSQAITEGRRGTEGIAESNLLPLEEAQMLIYAEEKDSLSVAIGLLRNRTSADKTLLSAVVVPNVYYLMILSALIYVAMQAQGLQAHLGDFVNVDDNPAFLLSAQLNTYIPILLLVLGAVLVAGWYLCFHSYSWIRKLAPFFATNAQLQMGAQFCELAAMFYAIGLTHDEVIKVNINIFSFSGFMRGSLTDLRQRSSGDGDVFSDALGETVLLPNIGASVGGLTPNGERSLFEGAMRSAAQLQRALLTKRYAMTRNLLQCFLLLSCAYLLLTMMTGIYSLYIT